MHSLELCKVRMDPQLSAIRERSSADWVSASVPDVAQFLFLNHLFRCFFSLYSNQFLLKESSASWKHFGISGMDPRKTWCAFIHFQRTQIDDPREPQAQPDQSSTGLWIIRAVSKPTQSEQTPTKKENKHVLSVNRSSCCVKEQQRLLYECQRDLK